MGEGEWAKAKHVLEALGRYSRVAYRGTEAHVRLINARLQEGMTVLDLRKVAWYCARVLEWESKPDMRHYLRPETLYGPKTLARYLDAALAAYREKFGTDDEVSNG